MADQLKALSWGLEGDYQVALVDSRSDDRALCRYTMLTLEQDPNMIDVHYSGCILAIYADAGLRADAIRERLASVARDFNRTVGLSERFADFGAIGAYFRQVVFALDRAAGQGAHGKLIHTRDYLLDYLSTAFAGELPLSSAVERLVEHDAAHGTELCRTLYEWLKLERNTVQTAAKLYIHRNTCKNRIEVIRGIVGEDLDEGSVRLELLLALHQLAGARSFAPASIDASPVSQNTHGSL